jgi:hypothetical protein
MSSGIRHLVHGTTLLLLVAAFVAPAAIAGHYGPGYSAAPEAREVSAPPPPPCHQYCGAAGIPLGLSKPSTPVIVRTKLVASVDRGFDWLDAAIGFGVACGAMLVSTGALVARRRARVAAAEVAG